MDPFEHKRKEENTKCKPSNYLTLTLKIPASTASLIREPFAIFLSLPQDLRHLRVSEEKLYRNAFNRSFLLH